MTSSSSSPSRYTNNSRQTQSETLSPPEESWRSRQPYLRTNDLELRSRYRPGWTPSWSGTDKDPRDCDDGPPRSPLCANMDATVVSHSDSMVNSKYVSNFFHPEEVSVVEHLNNPDLRREPKNPCVRLVRDTLHPSEDTAILITPLLRNYDDPRIDTIGELVDFLGQTFDGLKFLHDHDVAYRCPSMAVMIDPVPLFPEMYHPNVPRQSRDLSGRAKRTTRTRQPAKYFFTDFGSSKIYGAGTERKAEPIPGLDQQPPEFRNHHSLSSSEPHDPFPTDIYYLGSMIEQELLKKYNGLDFMNSLVSDMKGEDPNKRPTMELVVTRFQDIRNALSRSTLRSRLVRQDEAASKSFMTRMTRNIRHTFRTMGYRLRRLDPIPTPS